MTMLKNSPNSWGIKSIIVIAAVIAILSLGLVQPASATELPAAPIVVVNGYATASSSPDQAVVNLSVINIDKKLSTAQSKTNQSSQKLVKAIKSQGIEDKDITTTDYRVSPRYDYSQKENGQPPEITGYEVRNSIKLTIKDINKTGAILDLALKSGANSISNIRFDKADKSILENQALSNAVKNAQTKASTIASALGMKLGPVVQVNQSGYQLEPYPIRFNSMNECKGAGASINPGELNVSASITISYQLIQ